MSGFLPLRDREYLQSHGFVFEEQTEASGQRGVILRGIKLPDGKFDFPTTDLLFLMPAGYPDAPLDMFYTHPWVKLRSSSRFPRAADVPVTFGGTNWQRWSRHSDQWRPGRDGIWTMLKRFEFAVEMAE